MTALDCNVQSCCHNQDECCCLSSINVKGSSACRCDDTCCGSFYEESENSSRNSSDSPKINLSISCDATNCVFNDDTKCSADHIGISGVCASEPAETVCSSFKCK